MSGARSRRKGAAHERLVAEWLRGLCRPHHKARHAALDAVGHDYND